MDDVTGVILVGGKSRRMGRDKALLELGGRTLLERVLECFRESFREIVLVGDRADRFAKLDVPVYEDLFPGSALGGLYTALHHARTGTAFVSACDLPFPSTRAVRHLCALTGEGDVVVAKLRHGYEPLFAAYSRRCLEPAGAMLRAGEKRIRDLYLRVTVREVAESELQRAGVERSAFTNVNTPADYAAAGGAPTVHRAEAAHAGAETRLHATAL